MIHQKDLCEEKVKGTNALFEELYPDVTAKLSEVIIYKKVKQIINEIEFFIVIEDNYIQIQLYDKFSDERQVKIVLDYLNILKETFEKEILLTSSEQLSYMGCYQYGVISRKEIIMPFMGEYYKQLAVYIYAVEKNSIFNRLMNFENVLFEIIKNKNEEIISDSDIFIIKEPSTNKNRIYLLYCDCGYEKTTVSLVYDECYNLYFDNLPNEFITVENFETIYSAACEERKISGKLNFMLQPHIMSVTEKLFKSDAFHILTRNSDVKQKISDFANILWSYYDCVELNTLIDKLNVNYLESDKSTHGFPLDIIIVGDIFVALDDNEICLHGKTNDTEKMFNIIQSYLIVRQEKQTKEALNTLLTNGFI